MVILNWETASEINNSFFTIERSNDGEVFETIGKKPGAGNSSSVITYEYTENAPLSNGEGSGVRYYRLKQTDFDGNYSYSEVIAVQNCSSNGNSITNIFIGNDNEITIMVNSSTEKEYNVSFYDELGRKVHSEILNIKIGSNIQTLNPKPLSTGVYFITLQNQEEILSQKLFVH